MERETGFEPATLCLGSTPVAEHLLGKHYPLCAVLQTWNQSEMLSSYLLLRSSVGRGLLAASPEC